MTLRTQPRQSVRSTISLINAPYTDVEVQFLNENQVHVAGGILHKPLSCVHQGDSGHPLINSLTDVLIATSDGWVCPHCGYEQTWADRRLVSSASYGKRGLDRISHDLAIRAIGPAIEAFSQLAAEGRGGARVMVACLVRRRDELMGVLVTR